MNRPWRSCQVANPELILTRQHGEAFVFPAVPAEWWSASGLGLLQADAGMRNTRPAPRCRFARGKADPGRGAMGAGRLGYDVPVPTG